MAVEGGMSGVDMSGWLTVQQCADLMASQREEKDRAEEKGEAA